MSVLFHIDLNSFFASAEILKNSALEGQPVVVAGLHRRSVVSTASYEARAFGVHSAMPLHLALEKCPQLIVVSGDFEFYEQLSQKFFNHLRKYTTLLEPLSIDECYLDVTKIIKKYKRPLDLAWLIQKSVMEEVRLPCSIGVAANKFLAKMASDMRKPMGITILRKQEIPRKLWTLPIQDMYGIGKKSVQMLLAEGIETIGDLTKEINENKLMRILGNHAYQLIQHANGIASDKLSFNHTFQSISQSTTIDHDIYEYEEIFHVFKTLAKRLSERAIKEDLQGSLISISIRYFNFRNVMRSKSIDHFTNQTDTLFEQALLLFEHNDEGLPIRHLGITLGSLFSKSKHIDQINLFNQPDTETKNSQNVLKTLNKKMPSAHFKRASDILKIK